MGEAGNGRGRDGEVLSVRGKEWEGWELRVFRIEHDGQGMECASNPDAFLQGGW